MNLSRIAVAGAALAALAAIAFSPAAASAADPLVIGSNVTTFTLANGLQVVVIPDHRSPTVTHMVWYRVGSADDPPGKSGIAHFLEHLMFKGTRDHPAGDFSARVAAIGGNENAFTTEDATVYHQSVAKEHLGLMMEYEADRMQNLVIDDAAVTPERRVILEERRMRTDNSPGARLGEAVDAALYQNSHYGIPVIGWANEMAKLSRDDAVSFYDRYYTPNNAIVVVAGDVTEDEVRRLAEATYGKVPRRADPPPRVRLEEPEPQAARTVTLSDPRVTEPSVQRLYLVPSYRTADPGVAEALDLLAEVLGGSSSSRLYRQLVVEKGIATSAGAGYDGDAADDRSFGIYASPRGDTAPADLAAAIDQVIVDLIDKGVTDQELASAKRRIVAGAVYAQDSQMALARTFGQELVIGGTVADVQQWLGRISAVTPAQVVNAAKAYLDLRRSVTGYLVGPPPPGRS